MKIDKYSDEYKEQLIGLIDKVYKEYNDKVFLQGFDKDLLDITNVYFKKTGYFWILTDDDQKIAGCIAVKRINKETAELKRLYLLSEYRGKGFSDQLFKTALQWIVKNNYENVILWSDIRFERAHYFYIKKGFVRKEMRHMNDGAMPYSEYLFECGIKKINL